MLLLGSALVQAQNLVPNPSFEDYIDCPASLSLIHFPSWAATTVTEWSKPTNATSDYYNECVGDYGGGWLVSIPQNFAGYQYARTGSAYAGFIALQYPFVDPADYREYIQAQLLSPLIAGNEYYVSFYLSLAEGTLLINRPLAVDQIGACFAIDMEENFFSTDALTDRVPQVFSPLGTALNDTLNWMQVSGTFIAEGGEEWIIIGSFTPKDDINLYSVGEVASNTPYYFIDDVSVIDVTGSLTTRTIDTFLCSGTEMMLSGEYGADVFLWDDGSVGQTRIINAAGLYWIRSINESEGTVHCDTFRVSTDPQFLAINLGEDTLICSNEPQTLTVASVDFNSYRWSTGATTASIEVNTPGNYYVYAWSECYYGSDTIKLYGPVEVSASLGADINLCKGEALKIGSNSQALNFIWNTGEAGCCIDVNQTGTYKVTASNECGEIASDEIHVTFSNCDYCILAPTAFSPNHDGLNDQFEVHVNCPMKNYKLSIFNRWGQQVFSTVKPDNYWDGLINGKPADLGVYFYYIEATPAIEGLDKIVKKGDVSLVR